MERQKNICSTLNQILEVVCTDDNETNKNFSNLIQNKQNYINIVIKSVCKLVQKELDTEDKCFDKIMGKVIDQFSKFEIYVETFYVNLLLHITKNSEIFK